jgi:methylated-DNA-protein-cysteine methyltransferase-like protein
MIGSPGAARQVGWALANCRLESDDIPWHRIINAKGGISIRGRGDAAELQRLLLEKEGVEFDEKGCVDMNRFSFKN